MTVSVATNSASSIAFARKKENILLQLSVNEDSYDDLSPKGSLDVEIREFIDEINSHDGLVTTSSCSGRVSVFLEGQKAEESRSILNGGSGLDVKENIVGGSTDKQAYASVGGKGGGGRWLFVSHNPLNVQSQSSVATAPLSMMELFKLKPSTNHAIPVIDPTANRFIHFKFEPMILHILAADRQMAQRVLSAALQSGFRESGASSLHASSSSLAAPIPLAIRTTGLAFDNIIGFHSSTTSTSNDLDVDECHESLVSESFLHTLVLIANEKFRVNRSRTEHFRALLAEAFAPCDAPGPHWEAADVRKERKRAEGIKKKEELRKARNDRYSHDEHLDPVALEALSSLSINANNTNS